MKSFEKPPLSPIGDRAVQSALLKAFNWIEDADALIGMNFSRGVNSGISTVLGGGGTSDHGALTGLLDDDHLQYVFLTPVLTARNVVQPTAATVVPLTLKGFTAQTANLLDLRNSADRTVLQANKDGGLTLGNNTDAGNLIIQFGEAGGGPTHTKITFGDNLDNLSAVGQTADMIGVAGGRMYMYKDPIGVYDAAIGQSLTQSWWLVGPEDIDNTIWTGGPGSPFVPFMRFEAKGNGDFINYGFLRSRKSLGAVFPGVPGVELEETGAGVHVAKIRAPAVLTIDRTQLLLNRTGTLPLVGDDPPAVASGALGKVDLTAQAAAIGATNLTNLAGGTGYYVVFYTLETTTANATALTTVQLQVNYTDDIGATNQTSVALALDALGRATGSFQIHQNSAEVSYQTNVVGVQGVARYALRARIMYLG